MAFFDDRTEEDYAEDLESAVDFAIKLIDVNKMQVADAIENAAHRFNIETTEVQVAVEVAL